MVLDLGDRWICVGRNSGTECARVIVNQLVSVITGQLTSDVTCRMFVDENN